MPRILVVEDDAHVRLLVQHVLLDAGYEVDATDTLTSGFQLLRSRSYELVIADGKLPDGIGLELADVALRRGSKTMIMTGYAFVLPSRHEILLKPLRPQEIIDAVERMLQESGG